MVWIPKLLKGLHERNLMRWAQVGNLWKLSQKYLKYIVELHKSWKAIMWIFNVWGNLIDDNKLEIDDKVKDVNKREEILKV